MEYGIVAPHSATKFDNSVVWLARDPHGQTVAVRAQGWTPKVISDPSLHQEWASYSTVSGAYSQVWWLEGHPLWVLNFPSADKTWVYDSSLPEGLRWSEWQRYDNNPQGRGQFIPAYSVNFNNKIVCGAYNSGKIYEVDWDTHTDDGEYIHWSARSPEIVADDEGRVTHKTLEVFMETGVGLTDSTAQGHDPQVGMRYSDDHGETWMEKPFRSFGKIGEYEKRIRWLRLGQSRHRIYEVYGMEPVKTVITGGYLA